MYNLFAPYGQKKFKWLVCTRHGI